MWKQPLARQVCNVNTIREIDAAFATLASQRSNVFSSVAPALRGPTCSIGPVGCALRGSANMSKPFRCRTRRGDKHRARLGDAWRQVGVYMTPDRQTCLVVQSTKFELAINA